MAKWFGKIGFEGQTVETAPSVFTEETVEREYYGDVLEWGRQLQAGDGVNDNVTFQNRLSIVADPFAHENFGSMLTGRNSSAGRPQRWRWSTRCSLCLNGKVSGTCRFSTQKTG